MRVRSKTVRGKKVHRKGWIFLKQDTKSGCCQGRESETKSEGSMITKSQNVLGWKDL